MSETLAAYGMKQIADVTIEGDTFQIDVSDEAATDLLGCIYAFAVNSDILRIGSSAGPLKKRLHAWRRDVSRALAGVKSPTPHSEAMKWRMALPPGTVGALFSRRGTQISTPVGMFTAHLDEERILIQRHKPRINRSWR